MMRLALAFALVLLAFTAPAAAQEKDPVNITADKTLTVWAPKVVVEYGEAGPSSVKSFVASGGVRIKTPDRDATGDYAIYDPKAETLRITGNVMVVSEASTVGGPDLVIDLNSDTTVFQGSSNGRVTGVFTTQ